MCPHPGGTNSKKEDRTGIVRFVIRMFERFIEYLKRSLTIAWKSIFFNFKQYVFFFIAVIIVQMFFGVMTISTDNNNLVERNSVSGEYDYHFLLTNLNEDQMIAVRTNRGAAFTNDIYFSVLNRDTNGDGIEDKEMITEYTNTYGDKRYDMYVVLKGGDGEIKGNLDRFRKEYFDEPEGFLQTIKTDEIFMYTTPLMNVSNNILANRAVYYTLTIVLFALSVFLMMMLYNIRVNQYKFTYGVYMTFGADFKMLFNTAFWEMFVITVLCFIPSVLLSTVIVFFMYLPSGFGFTFPWLVFVEVFFFSLLVVTVAVFFPMRVMSVRMPMTLIVTEDNSNLVSSPKNSKNVFQKKFPTYYEAISSWRFRKYSANLLLTAIVFCAIFIMGLYLADIYRTDLDYQRAEFRINLENGAFDYDEEMSEELYSAGVLGDKKGIIAVEAAENYVEAGKSPKGASHILVESSDVKAFKSGFVKYSGKDFTGDVSVKATSNVLYNGITEEQINVLKGLGYSYEGNLEDVTKEGYVIVGDSVNNIRTYKYKVGDPIWVAVPVKTSGQIDTNLSDSKLLQAQIDTYTYEYRQFTIAAILTDVPSGALPMYFNTTDYEAITGSEFSAQKLNVYVDPSLTPDEVAEIGVSLRNWGRDYDSVDIENTYNLSTRMISYDKHRSELYIIISVMLLVISPIMWFFSQSLYYFKREQEFNILQALGARVRDIRNIYIQGGLQMAALSLVVSVALSYLGSYILFYVFNVIVPKFSIENVHVRYTFYMPWYAILTSIVVSVACGFLSAYLPYRSYYKNRFTLENGGAGSGED